MGRNVIVIGHLNDLFAIPGILTATINIPVGRGVKQKKLLLC
jgi:hypothetical protein